MIGDFNNVLGVDDRLGGTPIHPSETYTWFNMHKEDPICSRIDHVLGNVEWNLQFGHCRCEVLLAHILDHYPLLTDLVIPSRRKRYQFKFVNYWLECDGFKRIVNEKWQSLHIEADPRYVIWS